MSLARVAALTFMAMLAFAGNSLLCRLALAGAHSDPASFTAIRMAAGAAVLAVIVRQRNPKPAGSGNWLSAIALFSYAAAFSFAYVGLTAATGALLLFGSVQVTMISTGLWRGERLAAWQIVGMLCALGGLLVLLLPGLSTPPLPRALLMILAGLSWGIYSLRAKNAGDPTVVTGGNFLRTVPMALALFLLTSTQVHIDAAGITYALISGAIASGVGYAIWYTALRGLKATTAATVQLSVPILATLGGVALLAEPISTTLLVATVATLGGVALVILTKPRARV